MYTRLARTLPLLGALVTLGLAAPNMALAQDTQHNESDTDFLKRMIASLKQTERQAANLEETVVRFAQQQSLDSVMQQNDRYGSRNRNTASPGNDYRLAERRIRSVKNKAVKEQEKLGELQRSGENLKPGERDKVENRVQRLEREVEDFRRDLESGRL